jgi:pimeloyl-ACP methyl ester carboxylesterase
MPRFSSICSVVGTCLVVARFAAATPAVHAALPLSFEKNEGQTTLRAGFLARQAGYDLFLAPAQATLRLQDSTAMRVRFVGANRRARLDGLDPQSNKSNYFIGNDPKQWLRDIPNYGRVRSAGVYPGIDAIYHGREGSLEYDLQIAPGADPERIELAFEGVQGLAIDHDGDLELLTPAGTIVQRRPEIYQEIDGRRTAVQGRYVLLRNHHVGFHVGRRDRKRPLVIDPVIEYSSYLGGFRNDGATSIAVDSTGSAYVLGYSNSSDFPATTLMGNNNSQFPFGYFVTKINAAGTAIVYSTRIGAGNSDASAYAIAVDSSGRAYIAGGTGGWYYPTTPTAFQPSCVCVNDNTQNGTDAFLTVLTANGDDLAYSTHIGGNGGEYASAVAIDPNGHAYVAGTTKSPYLGTLNPISFPTTAGAFRRSLASFYAQTIGIDDGFVAKFDITASGAASLVYSTYLGGGAGGRDERLYGYDRAKAVAIDANGSAYVSGVTNSPAFPVTANARQSTNAGGYDLFLSKLAPDGSSLLYSTYLGGTSDESAAGIAVDPSGYVYLAATTSGTDIPTTSGAFQRVHAGGTDAVLAKLDPLQSGAASLQSCTYLGGSGDDEAEGIAVDQGGHVFAIGSTNSVDFPTKNAVQASIRATTCYGVPGVVFPCRDAFVTELDPAGAALEFSSYLGGHGTDLAAAIAVQGGSIYVAGFTNAGDFPLVNPFQPAFGGGNSGPAGGDAFVAKLEGTAAHATADAGQDLVVRAGARVVLQGGAQCNVAGAVVSWALVWKPPTSSATLTGANTLAPSFTADAEGTYTVRLRTTCRETTTADTVEVHATSCARPALFADPSSVRLAPGETWAFTGRGGSSGPYHWQFAPGGNLSGASLSASTGASVTYTAGPATTGDAFDTITMSDPDSQCGSVAVTVKVQSKTVEVIWLTAVPELLSNDVNVQALFSAAATQAKVCIDGLTNCTAMTLSADRHSATARLHVDLFRHVLNALAFSDTWGPIRSAEVRAGTTAMFLLNGYNFSGPGPHPEQWWELDDKIPCQLRDIFYTRSTCNSTGTSCPVSDDASEHDRVCVVTNLDGRANIDTNLHNLSQYIEDRGWLKNTAQFVLIGHSYGGQIARAFARANPDRVKAVITIDTPHEGAFTSLVEARKFLNALTPFYRPGDYDEAIQYFTAGGAAQFNERFSPRGSPTPIYTIASESSMSILRTPETTQPFAGSAGIFRATYANVPSGSDDIVPVDSQSWRGGAATADNVRVSLPLQTRHQAPPIKLMPADNLHNAVIEDRCLWAALFARRIYPILSLLLPASGSPPPDCAEAVLRSRAKNVPRSGAAVSANAQALVPSRYSARVVLQSTITLDAGTPVRSLTFSGEEGRDLLVRVVSTRGNPHIALSAGTATFEAASVDGLRSFHQIGANGSGTSQTLLVRQAAGGTWTLTVGFPQSGGTREILYAGSDCDIEVALASPVHLDVDTTNVPALAGETVRIRATVSNDAGTVTGAAAIANVIAPDGTARAVRLGDDGSDSDDVAGDGTAGGVVSFDAPGEYVLQVSASGSAAGIAYSRQTDVTISVGPAEVTFGGPYVEAAPDADADGHFDMLTWTFSPVFTRAGRFTISAELLAKNGTSIAHASTSVVAGAAGAVPLTLSFDGPAIYRSALDGPYTLSALRAFADDDGGIRGRSDVAPISAGPYWSWMSFTRDSSPRLTWVDPAINVPTTSSHYRLQWAISDGNGGTKIDIGYDMTGSGFAGQVIAADVPATQGVMTRDFDLSALPDGEYFFYARIRNGDYSNAVYGGSVEKITDSDGDGMADGWERAHGLDPAQPADALLDPDHDHLANADEYATGGDPHAVDSDGGGESDGSEAANGRDVADGGDDVISLAIASLSPAAGDLRGGEVIQIRGTGFDASTGVWFGAAAAETHALDASTLEVVTPPHEIGPADVTVTTGGGSTVTSAGAFTFLCEWIESAVTAPAAVCANSTGNQASGPDGAKTYAWTVDNGTIDGAADTRTVTFTAGPSGNVMLHVAAVAGSGCAVNAGAAIAVEAVPATPAIAAQPSVCANTAGNQASGPAGAAAYAWSISNGTIAGDANLQAMTYTAGASGSVTLTLTVTNASGCAAANSVVVAIDSAPAKPVIAITGPPVLCAAGSVTLTSSSPTGNQWLKDGVAIDGAAAQSYAATATGSYTVRVANGSCRTTSSPVELTPGSALVVSPPSIASAIAGQAYSVTFSESSGSGGMTFTESGTLPAGLTFSGATLSGTPSQGGSYPFTIAAAGGNGCSGSRAYTLSVALPAGSVPAGLRAIATDTSHVSLSWIPVDGAHHYEVTRSTAGGAPATIASPAGPAFTDTQGILAGTTYVYRVRSIATSGQTTAYSAADIATTIVFTDDPLIARSTRIKAVHLTQLRSAVNAVRAAAGLSSFPFTDASPAAARIRALHVQELRNALDAARSAIGLPALSYANAVAPPSPVRGADFAEIRNGVN